MKQVLCLLGGNFMYTAHINWTKWSKRDLTKIYYINEIYCAIADCYLSVSIFIITLLPLREVHYWWIGLHVVL